MTNEHVLTDSTECISRSREHAKLATVMFDTQQEWAAVCAFYAAYHLMRASLLVDPVFSDAHRLSRINPKILPEDRGVSKHSTGSLSKPAYGLNEIVTVLYPDVRSRYYRLHMGSIAVRYGSGLGVIRPENLQEDLAEITRAFEAGEVVCQKELP